MIETQFSPPIDQLVARLDQFEDQIKVRAVRSGLVRAAKPLKARVKALAPVRKGSLQSAIGHRTLSKTAKARIGVDPDSAAILVGPTRKVADRSGRKINQAYKAIWAEYGTRAHSIKAKPGSVLASLRRIFGTSVDHPGTPARPFLGPALAQSESLISEYFFQGLQAYLDRQAK